MLTRLLLSTVSLFVTFNANAVLGGKFEDQAVVKAAIFKTLSRVSVNSDTKWNFCTATQISEQVLITAAHCRQDTKSAPIVFPKTSVLASEYSTLAISEGDLTNSGGYNLFDNTFDSKTSFINDVAVIVLDKPLGNQQRMNVATIADLPENVFAAGYGNQIDNVEKVTEHGNVNRKLKSVAIQKSSQLLSEVSTVLLETYKNKKNDLKYLAFLKGINDEIAAQRMYCFKPTDIFNAPSLGDSGGPLYSMGADGVPILHGTFSTFFKDRNKRTVAYCYNGVSHLRDWLNGAVVAKRTN